ncbi:MAG: hypothetical protein Q8873_07690 [Bacillota bacterium]|nr:hypothetical protein [Bacillota bacterium]
MYTNPYEGIETMQWYKANLHTHCGTGKGTPGRHELKDVIGLYRECGYSVLAVTNRDMFTDAGQYEEEFDMTLIDGYEYCQGKEMLILNTKNVIYGNNQQVIDSAIRDGGVSFICHPNRAIPTGEDMDENGEYILKKCWSPAEIDRLSGFTGIEILNGKAFRIGGSGLAIDVWDYFLTHGKLIWGIGTDDFHRWEDLSRAFTVIYAPSRSKKDIINAIKRGRFYVSNGLLIKDVNFENNVLKISAKEEVPTFSNGCRFTVVGEHGRVLLTRFGDELVYEVNDKEKYIRVQITSEYGSMLWTQPFYRKSVFQLA